MKRRSQPSAEIIERNNRIINDYLEKFAKNRSAIEINFRKLLPEIKGSDRFTHLIHTYPAKLLVHIPYLFLNNTIFSQKGDFVLDPFSGSGTVLLEAIVAKRVGLGADANPLARLISKVKVTKLLLDDVESEMVKVIARAKSCKSSKLPDVVNRDYWFPQKTSESLARLLCSIKQIENEKIKDFMRVSFSNCVKKVSYADQNVSVPVRLNPSRYPEHSNNREKVLTRLEELEKINVFEKFRDIAICNIGRFKGSNNVLAGKSKANLIATDAKNLTNGINSKSLLPDNSVQLILTSPPYAGAQKYIRASSLSLGWTEMTQSHELKLLDQKIIGREGFKKKEITLKKTGFPEADLLISDVEKVNLVRAMIIYSYLIEMKQALNEMIRVLKPKGYLALVIGNNIVCGRELNTQQYFSDYLTEKGLELQFKLVDDIKSYGLMTKRNKTANIISREWILLFKK